MNLSGLQEYSNSTTTGLVLTPLYSAKVEINTSGVFTYTNVVSQGGMPAVDAFNRWFPTQLGIYRFQLMGFLVVNSQCTPRILFRHWTAGVTFVDYNLIQSEQDSTNNNDSYDAVNFDLTLNITDLQDRVELGSGVLTGSTSALRASFDILIARVGGTIV